MSDLFKKIVSYCKKHDLIQPHDTIIVGLSGGPDSVFLLHLLKTIQQSHSLKLIAAHLDHGWRKESAKDVEFCKNLAQSMNIQFVCAHASDFKAPKNNGSQEEVGRTVRRQFLSTLKKTTQATSIALAHHADDQIETFFIRLLRGTSLEGLRGMKPKADGIIRPLLQISKQEILHALHQSGISYLDDPTNEHDAYLRNRIRKYVIPSLKAADDRFETQFFKLHKHISSTGEYLDRVTREAFESVSVIKQDELFLVISDFLALDPFLHHPIALQWLCRSGVPFVPSTPFFQEIMRFLQNNKSERHQLSPHILICKKNGQAWITSR